MHLDHVQSVVVLRSSCSNSTFGQTFLDSYPLWCNLSIIPEIGSTNDAILQVDRLDLNPCGFENVFLFEALIPDEVYLMSLSNCFTTVNKIDVPFISSPSAFFFSVQERSLKNYDKDDVVELDVLFDMNLAFIHLNSMKHQAHRLNAPLVTETLSVVKKEYQPEAAPESEINPTMISNSNSGIHEILKFLEKNAERDAHDIDVMLYALTFVVMILLFSYCIVLVSAFKLSMSKERPKTNTCYLNCSTLETTPSISQEDSKEIKHGCGESQKLGKTAAHQVAHGKNHGKNSKISAKPNIKTVSKFLSHIEARSASQNDLQTALPNTFFPQSSQLPKIDNFGQPNFIPQSRSNRNGTLARQKKNIPETSPCSRLKQNWEEKKRPGISKGQSRVAFRNHIIPIEAPEIIVAEAARSRKLIVPVEGEIGSLPPDMPHTSQGDGSFLNEYW